MTTMRAARLHSKDRAFGIETVEVPEPGVNEVRIRVEAAGVCLSDVHLIDGSVPLPPGGGVTLGHEVAGTVDRVGVGVIGLEPGTRVLINPLQPTAQGMLTMGVNYDGGWAEYVVVPGYLVVPIADSIPFEHAAIVPDAVSTPWAAITGTGAVRPCETVGVWGLGGLGFHAVKLLRLIGAAPIVAIDPSRAARARALAAGADTVLDPTSPELVAQVLAPTEGRGLDVAFDFVGQPSVWEQAISALRPGGRLVIVGVNMADLSTNAGMLVGYGKAILGHYGSTPAHLAEVLRLLETGRLDLDDSITDTYPLSEAATAVQRLATKEGDPVRLVLTR